MVHFFTTLQREPFSTNKAVKDTWFNPEERSGILADYLFDLDKKYQVSWYVYFAVFWMTYTHSPNMLKAR